MRELKILVVFTFALALASCNSNRTQKIDVIPEPLSISVRDETGFKIESSTQVVINDSSMLPAVSLLKQILKKDLNVVWQGDEQDKQSGFYFELDKRIDSLSVEGYIVEVNKNLVRIKSSGPQGLFYAVETIRQMLPVDYSETTLDVALPACRIIDSPRFSWRGMHLDVSRHFMPKTFIKKYIDYLAMHKLNVFHWHLVDGIGWRIEIKSHPELTDIGAWRKVKEDVMPWQEFEVWREGDNEPKYGGYYTQDDVRDIVAYAADRFVTVVPEIELPGHSEVVFQCYPHLACKDDKGEHIKGSSAYCASNSKGYQLLEDVLDEVMELFPSEYIHIGGDEVDKRHWNQCPDCKHFMTKKDYDADKLQSHFINYFDRYLKSKGRQLIGWHEILEGELSPSATIMYWGGIGGVSDCLSEGHPTILTTGSHLYFDHYQSLSNQEPKAFGGYAPLKKVYEYEPIPKGLDKKVASLVQGVQANIWTEYMPTEEQVEYMLFPRIAALSEITWQAKGKKDWPYFRQKMDAMLLRYNTMGVNYAYSALRPQIYFNLNRDNKQLLITIDTELQADIYYTTNGQDPTSENSMSYHEPFYIDESATIKAIAIKNGKVTGAAEVKEAILHKARGAKVILESQPLGKYAAQGGYTLVDADFGGDKWGSEKWLGILNQDFEASIVLDQAQTVTQVKMSCIEETGAGIYFPRSIKILVSDDGEQYSQVGDWKSERSGEVAKTSIIDNKHFSITFPEVTCQYIKVKAAYQQVEDQGVFIFVDELIVE